VKYEVYTMREMGKQVLHSLKYLVPEYTEASKIFFFQCTKKLKPVFHGLTDSDWHFPQTPVLTVPFIIGVYYFLGASTDA